MHHVLFILFFLLTHISVFAQRTSDTESVQQTLTGFFDALADRNVERMTSFCTPDLIILEDGMLWNLDTLARLINNRGAITDFKRINKLDFVNTEIHKKTAWTYYRNHASITANGRNFQIDWLESAILIRRSKSWKLKLLHSTTIEDDNSN
jgi:ketosteroid isomerase-like protein